MKIWLLVATLLVSSGCSSSSSSSESPRHPRVHQLGEREVQIAGDALAAQLATYPAKDPKAVLRVADMDDELLHDEGSRRVVESDKFAVSTDPSRKPDFVLLATKGDRSVTWEIVDYATKRRVLLATAEF